MLIKTTSLILAILFSAMLALFSPFNVAEERWQDEDYLIESFTKIALQREYDKVQNPKLMRWEKPIKVYFYSDLGDANFQKELLSVHSAHLSYITGVPIHFVSRKEDANLFVIFTSYAQMEDKVSIYMGPPDNYRTALNEAICIAQFKANRYSRLIGGSIIIPVDYARQKSRFLDCIVEEITQLMGLPNDSNEVFPSIFNDVSIDSYLSPLDYLLLKLLYSPRLSPGMTVQQTLAALPLAIQDLNATNDIELAASRVQVHSLKSYLQD